MQSQRTFPPGERTRSARWPIAKLGSQPIPTRPGPSSRISARWSPWSSSIRAWSSFLNSRDSACLRARLSDESLIGILPLHQKLDPVQLRLDPHQRLEDELGVVEIRLPLSSAKHRAIVPKPCRSRKMAL